MRQAQGKQALDNKRDVPQYSPIEKIFHKHARISLLSYEEYYQDLLRKFETQRMTLTMKMNAQMEELCARLRVANKIGSVENENEHNNELTPPPPPLLTRSASKETIYCEMETLKKTLQQDLEDLQNRFDRSVSLIVDAYDKYMGSLAPSPSLLPIKVSITVPRKNMCIKECALPRTSTLSDVRGLLIKHATEMGDPLVSFGSDFYFQLKRPLGGPSEEDEKENVQVDEGVPIGDLKLEHVPIGDLKLEHGTEIVCQGSIVFNSDKAPQCFTITYDKANPSRVDYYRCQDCGFNWICSVCAIHCHKSHRLVSFMMDHKPSYACCYCPRKKKCCIENNRTAKKKKKRDEMN